MTGGGGGGVWLSCHYVKTELENQLEKDDKSIYYKKKLTSMRQGLKLGIKYDR